jgi:hypothetical protein
MKVLFFADHELPIADPVVEFDVLPRKGEIVKFYTPQLISDYIVLQVLYEITDAETLRPNIIYRVRLTKRF